MNTPAGPGRWQPGRIQAADAARNEIRRAVHAIARDNGSPMISRPAYRGSHATIRDAESLTGMLIARDLELAARRAAHDYIRAAREASHSWHDIGTALHLTPDADTQQTGDTIAEAAYTYAAGNPDTETARHYGRSFIWTCANCDHQRPRALQRPRRRRTRPRPRLPSPRRHHRHLARPVGIGLGSRRMTAPNRYPDSHEFLAEQQESGASETGWEQTSEDCWGGQGATWEALTSWAEGHIGWEALK